MSAVTVSAGDDAVSLAPRRGGAIIPFDGRGEPLFRPRVLTTYRPDPDYAVSPTT